MKLTGRAVLHTSPQDVWDALNDPAVLAQCIPGCESLTRVGEDDYRMTVTAGVAAIKGSYDGSVRLSDKDEPSSYVMHAAGAGGPGTVSATCTVRLVPEGSGTVVEYDAEAVVGGVVAGVGQRMIGAVAKKLAAEFFGNVDAHLSGAAIARSGDAQPRPAASALEQPSSTPQVFAGRPARSGPVVPDATSAAVGGVVALLGVLLGWLIGRRARG